jgi:type II secretory pathway component PulM
MIRLAKRERYFVIGVACFVGVIVLHELLLSPFFENRTKMQRGVEANKAYLREVMGLAAEYEAKKRVSQDMAQALTRRTRGFSLYDYLDQAAKNTGIKKHVQSMLPSAKGEGQFKESTVDMDLEAVTGAQLMEFLYEIESPEDLISIKRMTVKQNGKQDGVLDVSFLALTLEKI